MPFDEVLPKWKAGTLKSGGPGGPPVKSQKQAVAIMLSEKGKADAGNKEYASASQKHKKPSPKKPTNPAMAGLKSAAPSDNDGDE